MRRAPIVLIAFIHEGACQPALFGQAHDVPIAVHGDRLTLVALS